MKQFNLAEKNSVSTLNRIKGSVCFSWTCLMSDQVWTLVLTELNCTFIFYYSFFFFKSFFVWTVFYSIALTKQNFTLKYDTNIPRQVVRIPS